MKILIDNVTSRLVEAPAKYNARARARLTTWAPGYRYTPQYKRGAWDGKVRLWDEDGSFPTGLLPLVANEVADVIDEICDLRSIPILNTSPSSVDLREYQKDAIEAALWNDLYGMWWPRGVIQMATGCVDAATEYLSPKGWKKIDQYDGGLVGQYHDDGRVTLVHPNAYIKKECESFTYFHTKYGVDQALTPEHTVIYIPSNKNFSLQKASFIDVCRRHQASKLGFSGKFITAFSVQRDTRFPLNDAALRLQIAVMADGSFDRRTKNLTTYVRLKREDKKTRLVNLLESAGISYSRRKTSPEGFEIFTFKAPMRLKEYTDEFYMCARRQLEIICDEVLKWDGDNKKAFFTSSKQSADFIQYAFSATGRRASIYSQDRRPKKRSCEYKVSVTDRIYVGIQSSKSKVQLKEVPSQDGYKYCFSVPTGMLVLRRNNCIFVSGNSGKTEVAAAMIQMTNVPTLFLVNRNDLVRQSKERFQDKYGIECGTVEQGKMETDKQVTIATIQSLMSFMHTTNRKTTTRIRSDEELEAIRLRKAQRGKEIQSFLKGIEQVFVDEAHFIAATIEKGNLFTKALNLMPNAYMRWGLTATPFMRDEYHNWLLNGTTGDLLYQISNRELIKMGYLSEARMTMYEVPKTDGVPNSWPDCYESGIVLNRRRNKQIIESIRSEPGPILVLVKSLAHGELLSELAIKEGLDVPFVQGKSTGDERAGHLARFRNGEYRAIIASSIWDTGVDIPEIKTLILAAGGKGKIKNLQSLGRGLRLSEGKDQVRVIDFFDKSTRWLRNHSKARKAIWESEGFTVSTEKLE